MSGLRLGYVSGFLVMLVVGACADQDPSTGRSAQVFDSEVAAYSYKDAFNEREETIWSCMKAAGFDYEIQEPPDDLELDGSYEVRSIEDAQNDGYGLATGVLIAAGREPDPDEVFVPEPDTDSDDTSDEAHRRAESNALYGEDGNGGCSAEANLDGHGPSAYDDSLTELIDEATELTLVDSAYLQALDEWRGCMADNGLVVGDLGELFAELAEEARSLKLSIEGFGRDSVFDEAAVERLRVRETAAAKAEALCTPVLLEVREARFREILDAL